MNLKLFVLRLHAGFSAVLIATFLLSLPSFQAPGTPVLQKYPRANRIALQIRWFGWKGESFFEKRFHLRSQGKQEFRHISENRSGEKRKPKSQL